MGKALDVGETEYAVQMVKQGLMAHITTTLTMKGLSQYEAADLLNTSQPQISFIASGRHERFSIGHLVRLCRQLGFGVDLNFYPIDPTEH